MTITVKLWAVLFAVVLLVGGGWTIYEATRPRGTWDFGQEPVFGCLGTLVLCLIVLLVHAWGWL